MKKFVFIFIISLMALEAGAQQQKRHKFDAERFQASMEQFIAKEAALTPQESSRFFPVYREYMHKYRAMFDQMRCQRRIKPTDEEGCRKAIRQRDDTDIQMKRLQQQYHERFMDILPASKVYDVLKAEDSFHRQCFKKAADRKKDK